MPSPARTTHASLRIIAEDVHGYWTACFANPPSNEIYRGNDAMDAIQRLIANTPEWNVQLEDFEPDWENCSAHHLEMVLIQPLRNRKRCPDCGGTGKYVGLNIVELCANCGGRGSL